MMPDDDNSVDLFDARELLYRMKDAAFEPYRRSLRHLQMLDVSSFRSHSAERTSKGAKAQKRKSAFSENELKLGIDEKDSIPVIGGPASSARGARLRRPLYASLDRLSDDVRRRVQELSIECAALERRLVLAPTQDEEEETESAYDKALRSLSASVAQLSHLSAYRHVVDVVIPLAEQTTAASRAEGMLEERERLLEEAKGMLRSSAGSREGGEEGAPPADLARVMRAMMVLERKAIEALSGAVGGNDGTAPTWPGKHHLLVLTPPRTDSLASATTAKQTIVGDNTASPNTAVPDNVRTGSPPPLPMLGGGEGRGGEEEREYDNEREHDTRNISSHPTTATATETTTTHATHAKRASIGFLFRHSKKRGKRSISARGQTDDGSQ